MNKYLNGANNDKHRINKNKEQIKGVRDRIDLKNLASANASLMDPAMAAKFNLQEYLTKYIDGYLFEDLKSIDTKIPSHLHPGNAAYPMIITICSGMELLGALLRPSLTDKFNDEDGLRYFGHYWKNYLSLVNPEYKKYGEVARILVRNGLAHLFMTKPKIGVVKYNPTYHLKKVNGHLIFDATCLYDDFKKSYQNYAKPTILDGKNGTMLASKRLRQIIALYTIESDKTLQGLMKDLNDKTSTSTTTVPPIS